MNNDLEGKENGGQCLDDRVLNFIDNIFSEWPAGGSWDLRCDSAY